MNYQNKHYQKPAVSENQPTEIYSINLSNMGNDAMFHKRMLHLIVNYLINIIIYHLLLNF